jgi:EAL domain-containing protein (putative c-di-GMP-specific phosphodiesterase class I)
LLEHIVQVLHSAQFKPELLSFEITETAAIANLREATYFINSLTALGCQFALDDFGSGLSSFGYLKNLPVNAIKIDGMFVRDIIDDPFDAEMVKAINEIGHVMHLETIAEFVENAAILDKLRDIGVDFVQGYHLGKPLPIATMLEVAVQ